MKSNWRKAYISGKVKIKCTCGETFIHYYRAKQIPGRRKFCDRCVTKRNTASRKAYALKNLQQV